MVCSIFKLVVFVNPNFLFAIRIKVQCIFQILRIEVSKQSLAQFVKVECELVIGNCIEKITKLIKEE